MTVITVISGNSGKRKTAGRTGRSGKRRLVLSGISLLCSFLSILSLPAQQAPSGSDEEPGAKNPPVSGEMLLGLYAGYGLNRLSGNLSSADLPGVIPGSGECGTFQNGSGAGLLAGLLFDYRLAPAFSAGVRLEYSGRSGEMTYRCVDPAEIRLPDGSLTAAETEHSADITLNTVALHLLVGLRPFDFPLLLSFGPSLSFGFGGDYQLTERIVTPATAEFVSGGQEREYGAGTLVENGGTPGAGLLAALGYDLPAGDAWRLRPELSLALPFGDDISVGRITSSGIRFTLGIGRVFVPEATVEPVPVSEPVAVETEAPPAVSRKPLAAAIQVDNGSGWTDGRMVIRRFTTIRTRLVPLLPYIFFDNRRDELPERYVRIAKNDIDRFGEENLVSHADLDVYSHVLNIVGSRMRAYPDAELTLTGTAPDVAEGTPSERLAQERAESVRDYLNGVWGISNDRMRILSRRDPEVPTNAETAEGRAENRRVELTSNRIEILAPLAFTDTLSPVDKGKARLVLDGETERTTGWNAAVRNASTMRVLNEAAPLPRSLPDFAPALSSFADRDSLTANIEVRYDDGTVENVTAAVPVSRDVTYKPLIAGGQYSLILFDAANADLREEHRRVIDSIAVLLPEDARLSVYGYTDFLGDSTENRALSERRAGQVAERLRQKKGTVEQVQGLGEDTVTFNVLGLPEERMYARRVVIEVRRGPEEP